MSIGMGIAQALSSIELLRDWLGDGEAVHEMAAAFRAERCVEGDNGNPCPMNVSPNWLEKHITDPIAQVIKGQLELKSKMKLKLPVDDHLHFCGACGCSLKLKVWVPTAHLKNHTSRKVIDKTVPFCWLRKELQ